MKPTYFKALILTIFSILIINSTISGQNVKELINTTRELYYKHDYEGALALITQTLKIDSSDFVVYYNGGRCAALIEDKDLAFYYLNKAIKKGYSNKYHMLNNKDFKGLKSDERWQKTIDLIDEYNTKRAPDSVDFKPATFKEPLKDLSGIPDIIKDGFYMVLGGAGCSKFKTNYNKVFRDVLKHIEGNSKFKEKIIKAYVVDESVSRKTIKNLIVKQDKPIIMVSQSYVNNQTAENDYSDIFNIQIIQNKAILYDRTAIVKGEFPIGLSKQGSELLKNELIKQIEIILTNL